MFAKGSRSYTINLPTTNLDFHPRVLHHVGKASVENFRCVECTIGNNRDANGCAIMQIMTIRLGRRDVKPDPQGFDQVLKDLSLVLEREAAFDAKAQFHPAHNHPVRL